MNYNDGFTSEVSTDFLSTLAKDELSKNYMNAQVPNRASQKGKGKGKDKSKDDSATPVPEGLALLTPTYFPEDPGLPPEILLYSPQQYWEDLVSKHLMPPDFRGHNKIRFAYNIDPIRCLYDGNIRHPTPKGQNPTHAGFLDVPSILRTHSNCRGRNGGVPEHFNPFFQYVFAFGVGQIEHKRRVHTRSIRKMGCRTDGDHEVLKTPFQQGRKSLSLLQTAYDVA